MTTTDLEQLLREALVAVIQGDATVATLCGGTANVFDRWAPPEALALPAIGYEVVSYVFATGDVVLRLTAVADQPDANHVCRHLLAAAKASLTNAALLAAGVDAVVFEGRRETLVDAGDMQELLTGTPNFRQADEVMAVLVPFNT